MLARLTHASLAFAVTVVVYQLYVLLAVPFLEPAPAEIALQDGLAEEQHESPRRAPHKYREVLAAYFPEGHWTLIEPPKTFENEKMMLVLDDYRPKDNGELRVTKCALIFFPHLRVRGEPPPREAIVLEAPHGAVLQLDKAFRPGLESLGGIQEATLSGEIIIRSDMREPGPQDDLLLVTRNLKINQDLIRTDHAVNMRLGPHRGQGRVLEIRLIDVERAHSLAEGFNLGGIDSLEILQDVEAQLAPGNVRLFDQDSSGLAAPPVHITSQGSFRFNVAHSHASFEDQVRVTQVHPTGERDQLLCHNLSLFLAAVPEKEASSLGKLRPGSIRALGKDGLPVVLDVQSQRATARGERMWLEFEPRRITLADNDEVILTYQGSEIHAPMVRYTAPPPGSPLRVGDLLAAGNGWIRAQSGNAPSSQPLEIRWTHEMRLQRSEGQAVLSLSGRPRLEMIGLGQLWADALEVYLRESAADGSEADLLPGEVVPQQIVARGRISIDSAQLHGRVNELDVQVEYAPDNRMQVGPHGSQPRAGNRLLGRGGAPRGRTYDIEGNRLQMLLTVRQRKPEVTSIDVDGNVVFQETAANPATSEPLIVHADQLRVEHADSPASEIFLQGNPATVSAAGMSIRAEAMELNRGTSRAAIRSPGELELPVDRSLSGQPLATPGRLHVRWQGGMELDRDRITFRNGVTVESGEGCLQTEQLGVRLAASIQFDGATRQQRVELTQLSCSGGAFAQFSQRDARGLTSVQTLSLNESLVVNQQTGKVEGAGGGWLESVHLSKGKVFGDVASQAAAHGQRLRFLHVDFVRGVEGNLNHRRVAVVGDVEAVYGPVDAWEQKLKKSVRGMPEAETIWISAQRLGVAESPLHRFPSEPGVGPLELRAEENVTIEGREGEHGRFTTFSQHATYDQQKAMFVLEGDAGQPAMIRHEQYAGAPPSETVAHKFTYVRATGEVAKVEGLIRGGWKQFNTGQRPRGLQPR
ncbi:MAG: hypothetical protein MI725_08455 [Pirellulales bacterium]|nr:hypothetical protein [Pirellulales bacterium]